MSADELEALTRQLAPAQTAQAAGRCYQQRGGRRRRAPGAGTRPLLSDSARVLITVVYLRQICSQRVLSQKVEINPNSIGQALAETRQLLDAAGHTITPTTLRFTTAQAVADFIEHGHTPCPAIPELLSDPSLTGMSRHELTQLIKRLSVKQAAAVERRRHQRRGGDRLPGARGGVFRQKITDSERILATVLYQRGICTRKVLAELFDVSPRTIGNTILETRPLLDQDGHIPAHAPRRFRTAQDLLASVTPPHTGAHDRTDTPS